MIKNLGAVHRTAPRFLSRFAATAVEAERLGIVLIHFLRQHGYESADKTVKLSLPVSAVLVGSASP